MSSDHLESCIFCQIIARKLPANIVYEDETIIAFTDIKPAAKYHYLIVPKNHIKDVKALSKSDTALLEEMIKVSHSVLDSNGADKSDSR